jgi:hypothetical protein
MILGLIPRLADLVFLFTSVFTIGFFFAIPGLFGGICIGFVSKAVKNRNALAAGTVGFSSGVVGAFILCRWALPFVASHLLLFSDALSMPLSDALILAHQMLKSIQGEGAAMWTAICISVTTSGLLAFRTCVSQVMADKFCETCGDYMASRQVSTLSVESAAKLKNAIKDSTWAEEDIARLGGDGPARLSIFQCNTCKMGYLEVKVTFRAKWPDRELFSSQLTSDKKPKYKKTSKNWLAASTSVSNSQIDAIERSFRSERTTI